MLCFNLLHVLYLCAILIIRVCAEPTISPVFQQIRYPGPAIVRCTFPRSLTDCRVRVSEHRHGSFDEMLDFSLGQASASMALGDRATASYAGSGLSAKECGVSLRVKSVVNIVFLVECFGRSDVETWDRGLALVISTGNQVLAVTSSTPRLIAAVPGSDVSVGFKARGALTHCKIRTPAEARTDVMVSRSLPAGSRYRWHGAGVDRGECGATVQNVSASDAGVWTWFGGQGTSHAWQAAVVLVTSAPVGKPVLGMHNTTSLRVGDVMKATCHAPPGVPAPKLTWLLDGQEVRHDSTNDTLQGDLGKTFPWEPQGAVQTYTRQLSSEDFGKRLECRAELSGGQDSVDQLLTVPAPTSVPKVSTSAPSLPAPPAAGCPALATDSTHAVCTLAGNRVNCRGAPVPLESTARLTCSEGYKPQDNHPKRLTMRCTRRGWQPQPFACVLDCGHRRDGSQALLVGGQEALVSEFPWHVGVFRRDSSNAVYKYICGGSLVSPKFFVSAAHCFWGPKKKMNETLYKAAVGKHTVAWTTEDEHEQRQDFAAVHLPRGYSGGSKGYEGDIAVVEMSTPVKVTRAVNVVCVDWHTSSYLEDRLLVNHTMGTVPGWGISDNDTLSPTLRFVDLPFVPYEDCLASVPTAYQDNLLSDKICGGYNNRSIGVCQGDSGGGFVFPTRKDVGRRYFLRGVVSNRPLTWGPQTRLCEADHRSLFTRVSVYIEWIEGIVFGADDEDS